MSKTTSNWIQGLSVQERKKQGITTVMPGDKGFGEFIDDGDSVLYDVGQVDVEVNHSHMNKLRILHRVMDKWEKDNGQVSMDSRMGRMFESDLQMVEELVERGTKTMLEDDKEFLGTDKFLTREEMLILNDFFITYGGKRVTH